jgi:nitrous oxidase accessory protein NosD
MLDRTRLLLASVASMLCLTTSLSAQFRPTITINCSRNDILAIVAANAIPNTLINIKGTCTGPVNIGASGVELNGIGAAAINGAGKDAVTITGAQRVTLSGLTITGGGNGVVAQKGAQVTLQNDTVSGNALSGIVALANSSTPSEGAPARATRSMDSISKPLPPSS